MLGWTQEEIAEVSGVDQSNISRIMQNGEIAKLHNSISDWLTQGKTVEEAADEKLARESQGDKKSLSEGKSRDLAAEKLGIKSFQTSAARQRDDTRGGGISL